MTVVSFILDEENSTSESHSKSSASNDSKSPQKKGKLSTQTLSVDVSKANSKADKDAGSSQPMQGSLVDGGDIGIASGEENSSDYEEYFDDY